jgi:hypothetical protein
LNRFVNGLLSQVSLKGTKVRVDVDPY